MTIFFDTETTGLPIAARSTDPGQPHLVQLAWIRTNPVTGRAIDCQSLIIRPDGWTIPAAVVRIHGITTERVMDEGVPEDQALEAFLAACRGAAVRVAHNETFDARIIKIALLRYQGEAVAEAWATLPRPACTMRQGRDFMPVRSGPSLADLYRYLFGCDFPGAHDALADVIACRRCWDEIQRRRSAYTQITLNSEHNQGEES